MYPVVKRTDNYWHEFSSMSESFLDTIPTLDKHLDSFFDRNADGIIEEWGLVTSNDIRRLRMKLDFLSYEVNRLVIEKSNLEKRTLDLRKTIKELEESR